MCAVYRCYDRLGRWCDLHPVVRDVRDLRAFDLAQCSYSVLTDRLNMKPPKAKGRPDRKAPKPKPSRLEAVRKVIGQYADDLREVIKKLRQRLH